MIKAFDTFADSRLGSWVVNGLAVVAFILVLKIAVSRLPDAGVPGAIKAGVASV